MSKDPDKRLLGNRNSRKSSREDRGRGLVTVCGIQVDERRVECDDGRWNEAGTEDISWL